MQNNGNRNIETGALDIRGLAEYLHIGLSAAYDLVKRPGFPAVRITARRIIVPVKELDKWLQEQAKAVSAE